jgi:hypothetical protein
MAFENDLLRALGMSLLHSLWQGAVLIVILQFFLSLIGKKNASARYAIHFSGLIILTAGFFTTWYLLYSSMYIHPARLLNTDYGLLNTDYQLPITDHRLPITDHRFPSSSLPYILLWPDGQSLFTVVRLWLEPASPFLAAGWLAGLFGIALYTSGNLLFTHRNIRRSLFQPDPSLQTLFERAGHGMKFILSGRLRLTSLQVSPMVIGIIKPLVVVPVAVVNGLSPAQVEAIMLHELAHIRRHDPFMLVVQAMATRILFFHPLAWYLSAEIDRERENSCDDLVLRTNSDPITYIKALTMIQEMNMAPVPANALTGKPKRLLGRVMRLLKPETGKSSSIRMAILLLLLISCGITAYAVVNSTKPVHPKPDSEGTQPVANVERDTIKHVVIRKEQPEQSKKEEKEREKDLSSARRDMENAQIEMLKAQQELERAREQFRIAQEKFRDQDLAGLQHNMQDAFENFRLDNFDFAPEKNEEFRKQMELLQDKMKINQDEMFLHQEAFQKNREKEMEKLQEEMLKHQEEWNKIHPEILLENRKDIHLMIPDVAPLPPIPDLDLNLDVTPFPPGVRIGTTDSLTRESRESLLRELEEVEE